MKKEKEVVESILSSVRAELHEFLKAESEMTSSMEYEERVLELTQKFARAIISKGQGELPKSRNSKKKF